MNLYIIPPLLSLLASGTIIVIAILKSRLKLENIVFIIFCVFWSLLSPVFIAHQLFRGDEELILTIERTVHFFYVFTPATSILYIYVSARIGSKYLVWAAFVLSCILAPLTQTDYYITGLRTFSWGYIAEGGPAFQVLLFFSGAVLVYTIIMVFKNMRKERSRIIRLKMKYIVTSFLISATLTLFNAPAIMGIDFYPIGNFSFIPLAFLAYGVLRYRLLDFRSVVQITTVWAALSTIIVLPNITAFYFARDFISRSGSATIFVIAVACFILNYHYFRRVQPLIDRLMNKRKLELKSIQTRFLDGIYTLRGADELSEELAAVLKQALNLDRAEMIICASEPATIPSTGCQGISISSGLRKRLAIYRSIVEREFAAAEPFFKTEKSGLMSLFDSRKSEYIIPLSHLNELTALIFLFPKADSPPLSPDEIEFIKSIKSAAAVSLANALLYSDLDELKSSLEQRVAERTAELENSMITLMGVIDTLAKDDRERVMSYFTTRKVREAADYIDKNFQEEISRESLAEMLKLNADYLGRSFKKMTGKNINDYIYELRIKKACELLSGSDKPIIDIAFESGFESLPTFYRTFKKFTGLAPVNFRQQDAKTETDDISEPAPECGVSRKK